jgi:hypothetical protein
LVEDDIPIKIPVHAEMVPGLNAAIPETNQTPGVSETLVIVM